MAPEPYQPETSLALEQTRHASNRAARNALPQSRRMRLCELGYDDIPLLSSLFAQTGMHPLLMESPTRFIDVAAIVACAQRLYARARGLGAWRANTLDGTFIGLFSLLPIAGSAEVELHVRLKPETWGRWYAIEGTHLLCRQAFDNVGLPRLFGYCHPDQRRVQRIMLHFGFHHLGLCEHRGQMAHRYVLDEATWRERKPTAAH
jgi:RimJ/RimL family protein N-acetyltransferase